MKKPEVKIFLKEEGNHSFREVVLSEEQNLIIAHLCRINSFGEVKYKSSNLFKPTCE